MSVTLNGTEKMLDEGLGEQCVYMACCCCINSFDLNDCKPTCDMNCCAILCGQTSKSYYCCLESTSAMCLCPQHPFFDQTLTGPTAKENVCCILCNKEINLVKPYCLSSERPLCKAYSDGCCIQTRQAFPCDSDVPGMCALYGIKCCDCAPFACDIKPCAKLAPLSKAAQASSTEVEEANISSEYLICAYGCCIISMYIPDTYTDAFGISDNSLCCLCYQNECKACLLPKDKSREEAVLLLGAAGQGRMIKPPVMSGGPCCKGSTRTFCAVAKFAFPCDDEVPFVVAVLGTKICERTIQGDFKCGDDKKLDVTTGKKPLFAKINTVTPKSVKAANPEGMERT